MASLTIWQKLHVLWRAVFDERTPTFVKVLLGGAIFYDLFPFDLIPDFFPVIGEIDDMTITVIALIIFFYKTKAIREEIRRRMRQSS